jgi:hypothetical protein
MNVLVNVSGLLNFALLGGFSSASEGLSSLSESLPSHHTLVSVFPLRLRWTKNRCQSVCWASDSSPTPVQNMAVVHRNAHIPMSQQYLKCTFRSGLSIFIFVIGPVNRVWSWHAGDNSCGAVSIR